MIDHTRVTVWMFRRLLSGSDAEAILGDLTEERVLRAETASAFGVSRWYWSQVVRSLSSLAWARTGRGSWLFTLGVASLAYLIIGVIETTAGKIVVSLFPTQIDLQLAAGAFIGLATIAFVAYFAALVRRAAANVLAVINLVAVAIYIALAGGAGFPFWYQILFLIFGPLASIAGGALASTGKRAR